MNNKKSNKKVSTKKKVRKKGAKTTNTKKSKSSKNRKNNRKNTTSKKSFNLLAGNDIMPFGKHKGMLVKDLPEGYYNWLITNTDVKIDRSVTKPNVNTEEDNIKYKLHYVPYTKEDKQKATAEIEHIAKDLDLTLYRARIIYNIRLSRINKVGNPTANDWD